MTDIWYTPYGVGKTKKEWFAWYLDTFEKTEKTARKDWWEWVKHKNYLSTIDYSKNNQAYTHSLAITSRGLGSNVRRPCRKTVKKHTPMLEKRIIKRIAEIMKPEKLIYQGKIILKKDVLTEQRRLAEEMQNKKKEERAKQKAEKVAKIKELLLAGVKQPAIAAEFGITQQAVSAIRKKLQSTGEL